MKHTNLVVQLVSVAFFCLCMATTGFATRKEELERAAELAVERAAEIVAERAVEKALESGNSSTETETIRMSHSSVRKQDLSWQLPGFATPHQYKEYERIIEEQEAGERAVAQIKGRHRWNRQTYDGKHYSNPTVKPIDISTFPYRSTPLRFFSDQYQYQGSQSEEKHGSRQKESKEENSYENSGKLLQQPLEVFRVTPKTFPVFYYFSKPTTYPAHLQYFLPQSQEFIKDDNKSEKLLL